MRLSFSGAPEVAAPIADVWPRLIDPHFISRHAPGVQSVDVFDARHFRVIAGFGVGPIRLQFGMRVAILDLRPPHHLCLEARGRALGAAVVLTAALGLEAIHPARTRLSWRADTEVSEYLALGAARLIENTAQAWSEQFWTSFATSIAAAGPLPA
jgi:carbon monoxide dehydrogenase subunit G